MPLPRKCPAPRTRRIVVPSVADADLDESLKLLLSGICRHVEMHDRAVTKSIEEFIKASQRPKETKVQNGTIEPKKDAERRPSVLSNHSGEWMLPATLPGTPHDHDDPELEELPQKPSQPKEIWMKAEHLGEEVIALPTEPGPEAPELPCPKLSSQRTFTKTRSKKQNKFVIRLNGELVIEKSLFAAIAESRPFQIWGTILIITNSVFVGWQTQYLANRAQMNARASLPQESGIPDSFFILQCVYTVSFLLELLIRWAAEGFIQFLRSADIGWNALDILVVLVGSIDTSIELYYKLTAQAAGSAVMGNFSVLKALRVIRIVRVAQVIRVSRFFRELRMMIFSILNSTKSLLWVFLVLGLVFYIFGVSFVAATTAFLQTTELYNAAEYEDLVELFGTLDVAMFSLYCSMSGGNDWAMYFHALAKMEGIYHWLFLLFITFCLFAVVNIVTGVFVDSAMQANQSDKDIIIHEEMQAKQQYRDSIKEMFDVLDGNGNGMLTRQELQEGAGDERLVAYFKALQLDLSDAETMFALLDTDGSGQVSIEEFADGCWTFQGEAKSIDTKKMMLEVKYLSDAMRQLQNFLYEKFK